jgi:hypothetical protein
VSAQRREQLRILARVLFGAAVAVLVLSVVGAIQIGTSESDVVFFGDVQDENRGVMTVGALGAGVFAAGVLAALGAILAVLLDREER